MWDPLQYQQFGDERSRPFFDLTRRIHDNPAHPPRTVVDLGCGPGNLTATLADRWPGAEVNGIDSSSAMIADARKHERSGLRFTEADIMGWKPADGPGSVDVIVTNAALQWVPGHVELLGGFVEALAPGGWLALQVPANLADPHHQAIREVATSPRWAPILGDGWRRYDGVVDPIDYAERLAGAGCDVDAWETTYLHVLPGDDPVLAWIKGTALRPVLNTLAADPDAQAAFCNELAPLLRAAYPRRSWGTPFPFRRVFAVGSRR